MMYLAVITLKAKSGESEDSSGSNDSRIGEPFNSVSIMFEYIRPLTGWGDLEAEC